jgi:hypothetical protein
MSESLLPGKLNVIFESFFAYYDKRVVPPTMGSGDMTPENIFENTYARKGVLAHFEH